MDDLRRVMGIIDLNILRLFGSDWEDMLDVYRFRYKMIRGFETESLFFLPPPRHLETLVINVFDDICADESFLPETRHWASAGLLFLNLKCPTRILTPYCPDSLSPTIRRSPIPLIAQTPGEVSSDLSEHSFSTEE